MKNPIALIVAMCYSYGINNNRNPETKGRETMRIERTNEQVLNKRELEAYLQRLTAEETAKIQHNLSWEASRQEIYERLERLATIYSAVRRLKEPESE